MSAFGNSSNSVTDQNSIVSHIRAPKIEMQPKKFDGRSFGEIFQQSMDEKNEIKFSQHAVNRMQMRGIELDEKDVEQLANAMDKMLEKGGKESLVMLDGNAFVVDVNSRTVITVANNMNEGVFTNIDSAMVLDSRNII